MTTEIQPFPNLEPLTNYLESLEEVTKSPSEETIAQLLEDDATLTARAMLFHRRRDYVDDKGYQEVYESCTVSDGVNLHARLALLEPGSEAYYEEYDRQISRTLRSGVDLDFGRPELRRNAARGALIHLGGKLAVSGAFDSDNIKPAYQAIKGSLDVIGERDKKFTAFGLLRIRRDLFTQYLYTKQDPANNPIDQSQALRNIDRAWSVAGRPYGVFTKLVAALI